MAYTKNYYHILNLPAPSWGSSTRSHPPLTVAALRRAYKTALLAAHPDKSSTPPGREAGAHSAYTVDDVKEAYAVLAKPGSRAEYDEWVVRNWGVAGGERGHNRAVGMDTQSLSFSHDFVLGLEVLDLGDFEVDDGDDGIDTAKSGSGQAGTQWTRPCRCGAATGFRILEEELEDAEKRGEKEVLVGCEGCSLWVRVGFDVEEG
ncbi:hypothetical protein IQ07DRAFT_597576 [Pyrenochaeta sp. DS3sAY3a]|nr:hypothetical protein IQ07DRAFT_597576 [Pyrenochaeta sp. DS3sAY3a]